MRLVEIFYSIQGEGTKSGDAAVFIRFAGCNLKCSWCDTDYRAVMDLTPDEILKVIEQYPKEAMVVLTGGEPFMQPTDELKELVDKLSRRGFVAVETNGTIYNETTIETVLMIDWITVSPKPPAYPIAIPLHDICELKYIATPEFDPGVVPKGFRGRVYLQPLSQEESSIIKCVDWIMKYPKRFSLSTQLHKYLNLR